MSFERKQIASVCFGSSTHHRTIVLQIYRNDIFQPQSGSGSRHFQIPLSPEDDSPLWRFLWRTEMKSVSFPPVALPNNVLLILGSSPGKKSLQVQQYYAHPQNLFWEIMDKALGIDKNSMYESRLLLLNQDGIALWDVLEYCEREGSLDSNIQVNSEVPNNFGEFFERIPSIRHIFFQRGKS
jgi:hypoxanthine-DNA glycosylase